MTKKLTDCKEDELVKIIKINAGNRATSKLIAMGLNIGDAILVTKRAPFHGPVLVEYNNTTIAIGHGLAKKIIVKIN